MKKEVDLIAAGYPSIDYIIRLKNNPKFGHTTIIQNKEHIDPNYGGCNVNIAYLCSKMNRKARLAMRVGNDFSNSGFKAFLEDGGVDTSNLQVIDDDITSTTQLIMNEAGDHITLFYPGAMNSKYPVQLDEELVKKTRFGVVTVGEPTYNKAFAEICMKHQVPLVFGMKCDFEAFTPENLMEIMNHSELIFMNEGEQFALEDCLPIKHITDFLGNGITKNIIVTLGCKGSKIYFENNGEITEEYINITKPDCVVDTTGVGDAYIAGFLHAYLDGKTVKQCGQSGSVMSSFIIEKQGCLTNTPTKEQFYTRYLRSYQEEF